MVDNNKYNSPEKCDAYRRDNNTLKTLSHKSFEERLLEYNGKISICEFDWGEPKGREFF